MAWWLVHGLEVATVTACTILAFRGSRRLGAHTPYGAFLFVLALGFWFLLCGNLLFRVQDAFPRVDAGAVSIADAIFLAGWGILSASFALFFLRFPRRTRSRAGRAATLLLFTTPPALAMVALYALVLNPTGLPASGVEWLELTYLVKNGIALGLVAASVERLVALRESALGRLYALMGVAIVVNAIGDVGWLYATHRTGWDWRVSVVYAGAGLIAVAALALHARLIGAGAAPERYADPTLRTEQRVLRDLGAELRNLVGGFGERVVVDAAREGLARRGVPHRADGAIVDADADARVWREVLEESRDHALAALGDAARPGLAAVADAYGSEYAFLTGGERA